MMKVVLIVAAIICHGAVARQWATDKEPDTASDPLAATSHRTQAYVTLLYDDSFTLGVRVLGQSLRSSGTDRDLVVIVAGNVSSINLATLATDGWKVHRVDAVENPGRWTQTGNQGRPFPPRFWGVYTKLMIFNLTEYERIVYMDADTVVVRNVDELFLCDGLCAVLRHSERFNTGVMVVEPSTELWTDMMNQIATTPSYTGGDQGFLNQYFAGLPGAGLFDPGLGQSLSKQLPKEGRVNPSVLRMARLPTAYNADLGLYIANSNRWTLKEESLGIVHYTLSTFKPWDWWSMWLLGENGKRWALLRASLPVSADGRAGGWDHSHSMACALGFPMPWLIACVIAKRWGLLQRGCSNNAHVHDDGASLISKWRAIRQGFVGGSHASHSVGLAVALPFGFDALAIAAGLASVGVAVLVAICLVPRQIQASVGWGMAYQWGAATILVAFGHHLRSCYRWGRSNSAQAAKHLAYFKDSALFCCARPWGESIAVCCVLLLTLGMLPWWTDVFGMTTLAGKIIGTAVAFALSTVACSQCFVVLAGMWYTSGAADAARALAGGGALD